MDVASDSQFTINKLGNRDMVQARISADLSIVIDQLTKDIGTNLVSLILVGGFGRGEGAILIENGEAIPINDYDFVMVLRKQCDVNLIAKIRRELAEKIGIWWVDISVYTVDQLRRLRYTMYNYDLKYGSQVIYGDPSILSLVPNMDPAKMPLVEAEIQFHTRLWCFLGPFSVQYLEKLPTEEDKFFLANQLSKALLACSDALLILNGQYHYSYAERLRRFEAVFQDRTDLLPLIREATEFKLHPTREIHYDVIERWFHVRHIFLDTMWYFVNQLYWRQFHDWRGYAWHYRYNFRQVLFRLGHLLLKRNLQHEQRIRVNLAQLFLLASFEQRDQFDNSLFDLAKLELSKIVTLDQSALDWDTVRDLAVQLRMEV